MQSLSGDDRVEHVESDKKEYCDGLRKQGTVVSELGPRLNHLRDAQARALHGVESHKEGAEAEA